jgi:hypothetical protein
MAANRTMSNTADSTILIWAAIILKSHILQNKKQ